MGGPVVYISASDGSSNEGVGIEVTTGLSRGDVLGHVVVAHKLTSGVRIACGVIEEVEPVPATPTPTNKKIVEVGTLLENTQSVDSSDDSSDDVDETWIWLVAFFVACCI